MKRPDLKVTITVNRVCSDGVKLMPLADLLKAVQCCVGAKCDCSKCPMRGIIDCGHLLADQARRWQARIKVENAEDTEK